MSAVELATSEPGSLAQVDQQCRMVEAWAAQTEDVVAITDAKNKLAAIDAYLERTAVEGRALVAGSMRRLEARIGHLIGEAEPNGGNDRNGSLASDPFPGDGLTRNERNHFRNMAEHEDVVERVIAESDDEHPARDLNTTAFPVTSRTDLEPSLAGEGSGLTRNERNHFRSMAESDDEHPATSAGRSPAPTR